MTRVLLRLKLALLRNSMRSHPGLSGGVLVAYGIALMLGLAAGGVLLATRGAGPGVTAAVALGVPTVLFLGWLTGPMMTSGFDSTVDPTRLAVYPLTSRQLTTGLFAVACLGGGGLFSALTLGGAIGATAPGSWLAVVSLAAGLSVVGVSVAASRAMAAVISGASRRVRDALLFVIPSFFLGISILPVLLDLGERTRGADLTRFRGPAEAFATVLPSGPGAQSLLAAAEGRAGAAVLWLGGALVWILLMLAVWSLALRRLMVRAVSAPAAGARNRRVPAAAGLYPPLARWLPRTRAGAVAAKELRLSIRDPRQRVALLGSIAGAIPFAGIGLTQSGTSAILRVSAVAFFAGANATNLYGFDGSSHWMNLAAGDNAKADLAGKCAGRALVVLPVVIVLVTGVAVLTGTWSRLVPALALAVAGLGLGLGPAAWVSVAYPWPHPAEQKNVFANVNTGQGLRAVGPMLLILLIGSGVLFSLGLPMARDSAGPVALAGLASLALMVGVAVFLVSFRRAVSRSADRQPELLLALTKS